MNIEYEGKLKMLIRSCLNVYIKITIILKIQVLSVLLQSEMFIFDRENIFNPKFIINFPTKRHWKGKSRLKILKLD